MPEEPEEITARFRLTLDFDISVSTEILQRYTDEDDLGAEEQRKLRAQRSLMKALLSSQHRHLLDELIRKRILEDAEFEVDYETVKNAVRVRDITEDVLLEAAIDSLPVADQQYFQDAVDNQRFSKDADEVVNSVGVDLIGALLEEVEEDDDSVHGQY